jgi:hypothetical protein
VIHITQDFLNIVLEYVENGSLADTVKKFGSLPESLIAVYIEQARFDQEELRLIIAESASGAGAGGVVLLALAGSDPP